MSGVFDTNELDHIEQAFEMNTDTLAGHDDDEDDDDYTYAEFGEAYDDDGERLVAIMENIIANDGTFLVK